MKNIKTLFATLILAFGIIFYAQAQTFLTNGLLAYYPFNGNANDASGNGNNATLAGNYQFVANGLGKLAFEANGDDSLYYSGGGNVLLPTFSTNLNSGFTLSVWAENEMLAAPPSAEEDYISFGTFDTGAGWISLNAGTAISILTLFKSEVDPPKRNILCRLAYRVISILDGSIWFLPISPEVSPVILTAKMSLPDKCNDSIYFL